MIKNFTLQEMLRTSVGKDNFPATFEILSNLIQTTERLQVIRDKCGFPINVNSCFRSEAVNNAVGGSSTSMHTKALAVDVKASSEARNRRIYEVCRECMGDLGIDQLIMYNIVPADSRSTIRFIHIGFTDGIPRHQLLFK